MHGAIDRKNEMSRLGSSGPVSISTELLRTSSVSSMGSRKSSGSRKGWSPVASCRKAGQDFGFRLPSSTSTSSAQSELSKNYISLAIYDVRKGETLATLPVRWWDKISDIKVMLRKITHEQLSRHHLYLPKSAKELSNNLTLHDIGYVGSSSSTTNARLRVIIDSSYDKDGETFSLIPFNEVMIEDEDLREMIEETRAGLSSRLPPGKTDEFEGSGGVYFMRSPQQRFKKTVAVFKPLDEEPGMLNNPKGRSNETLRDYFAPGQGCFREVAAYVFDVDNFCSVPPTALIYCEHSVFNRNNNKDQRTPKVGSLQAYVDCYSDFEGIGPNLISDFEIQKIALLDLRILNCDRNGANILVRQKSKLGYEQENSSESDNDVAEGDPNLSISPDFMEFDMNDMKSLTPSSARSVDWELIPIDHGYSMPSRLKVSEMDWVWFNSGAVKRPVDPKIREYVRTLDIDSIIEQTLEYSQLSEECIYLLRCAHHFVVNGIENDLTLHEIASLMARDYDDEIPSKFEVAFDMVEENAFRYFDVKSSSHGHSRSRQVPNTDSLRKGEATNNDTALHMNDCGEFSFSPCGTTASTGMEGAQLRRMSTMNEYVHPQNEHAPEGGRPVQRLSSLEEEPSPSSIDTLSSPPSTSMGHIDSASSERSFYSDSSKGCGCTRSAEKAVKSGHIDGPDREDGLSPIPFNLTRVVSFSGFENAKIYNMSENTMNNERAFKNLSKNRNELVKSSEFKKYRLDKMIEAMSSTIGKVLTARSSLRVGSK